MTLTPQPLNAPKTTVVPHTDRKQEDIIPQRKQQDLQFVFAYKEENTSLSVRETYSNKQGGQEGTACVSNPHSLSWQGTAFTSNKG